ncbi:hypothetical protein [Aureimonas ureilytica]|uniref:hypothetical protein n=1 Tax=Aureimonas ureilytica TaxID=401562 RepID=UPI0003A5E9CC|nr:hypothetical protein [Aureimonas ureilytica]
MTTLLTRGLDAAFLDALEKATDEAGWWRDVLLHPDLFVAVRRNYLNVYHRGASVFLIELRQGRLVPKTHVKYLVRQRQSYAGLEADGAFALDPAQVLWTRYEGPATLKEIVRAAASLAGPEKSGLHPLLMASPNVVDVEIALAMEAASEAGGASSMLEDEPSFSLSSSAAGRRVDRLDVAVLAKDDIGFSIVFHEAKHFTNAELRARADRAPPVADQMQRYRKTLSHHAEALAQSYLAVCVGLLRIDAMRQRVRSAASDAPAASSLSPTVAELVAAGRSPRIDLVPRLLVFGFDAAQRDDPAWKAHRDRLEKEFGLIVRAIGNTRGRVAAAFG